MGCGIESLARSGDGRNGGFAGAMKYRLTLSLSVLTLVGSVVTGRGQDAGEY